MSREERLLRTIYYKGNCNSMRSQALKEGYDYCRPCTFMVCLHYPEAYEQAKLLWYIEFSDNNLEEALFDMLL